MIFGGVTTTEEKKPTTKKPTNKTNNDNETKIFTRIIKIYLFCHYQRT